MRGSSPTTCGRCPGPGTRVRPMPRLRPTDEPEVSGTPGLIPPMRRGHSGGFLTDVVVDLGYATREQVEHAIAQSRTAGPLARGSSCSSRG